MSKQHWNPWHDAAIERAFIDLSDGQMHIRRTRAMPRAAIPLLMLHASPASSRTLVPYMRELAPSVRCIAPDTPGFGDSAPPSQAAPTAADYAKIMAQLLDALGLGEVDLYGSHTGAHIAVELALQRPRQVRRLILDGVGLFDAEQKQQMLANYAPAVSADDIGGQFNWAWHFVRDQCVYFPYFMRDAEHLRMLPMADARTLHATVTDVLKALTTYHLGYRAAFSHDDRAQLAKLTQSVLVTADASDPLRVHVPLAAELIRNSRTAITPPTTEVDYLAAKIRVLAEFLGG
ncbi:MAG: alpha/beta hydrolase [Steroidobacteraceae bacterium]